MEKSNTALLVIDVQQGLFERSTPVYQAKTMLDNINFLVDSAHQMGVPVIYIQHSNEKTLKLGTPEWKFHPEINHCKEISIFTRGTAMLLRRPNCIKRCKTWA